MAAALISHWAVRSRAEVPPGSEWLSEPERRVLARLRLPGRRADWRVGRWAGKQALAECLRQMGVLPRLPDIAILAAPDGTPEPHIAGIGLEMAVSLSHSGGLGFAVACDRRLALGCDIERVEQRSAGFVRDYFTAVEAALVTSAPAATQPFLATLLWSAKESALKALRQGLRADTRTVEVRPMGERGGGRCGMLSLRCTGADETLRACWWLADGFVHTIAGPEDLFQTVSGREADVDWWREGAEWPAILAPAIAASPR